MPRLRPWNIEVFPEVRRLAVPLLCLAVLLLCLVRVTPAEARRPFRDRVVAVFDGDTVLLASGERVRYLGIDAPEIAHGEKTGDCFGEGAREANAALVEGRVVTLSFSGRKRDDYGRLLAFVLLPDGRNVNEELVRAGAAVVYRTHKGFRGLERFLALQREAMREGRGLWEACRAGSHPPYPANRRSFVFHRPECPLAADIARRNRMVFETREAAFQEGYHPCRECRP